MMHRNASTSHSSASSSTALREPSDTRISTTGSRLRHALLGIALTLAACGGGKHTDSYAQATSKQQACCDNLTGADRDQCMSSLVTVDDPSIASSDTNQASYRCIEDHFVCDPQTGHASPESAQEQYDCIAELGQ
jgi:hypothetical protein